MLLEHDARMEGRMLLPTLTGAADVQPPPACDDSIRLLVHGGFAYFDTTGQLVQINAVANVGFQVGDSLARQVRTWRCTHATHYPRGAGRGAAPRCPPAGR
jgi:hypothetical protein